MTAPKRCPGCSRPISKVETRCTPCHLRLPEDLQRDIEDAERTLRAKDAEAHVWLGQHPHATERELQVIALAAQGRDNDEIAEELSVSVHTVRDYWRNLSKRWGCRGRAHVVATAFRLGYMSLEVTA